MGETIKIDIPATQEFFANYSTVLNKLVDIYEGAGREILACETENEIFAGIVEQGKNCQEKINDYIESSRGFMGYLGQFEGLEKFIAGPAAEIADVKSKGVDTSFSTKPVDIGV